MFGRPEPVVTGVGPINRDTIDRYSTMAVMPFVDAAAAQGSGSRVAGIVTTLFVGFGHQYGRTSQARRSVQRTGRPTTIRR